MCPETFLKMGIIRYFHNFRAAASWAVYYFVFLWNNIRLSVEANVFFLFYFSYPNAYKWVRNRLFEFLKYIKSVIAEKIPTKCT